MTSLEIYIKHCFPKFKYEINLPEVKIYYSKNEYILIRGTGDEIIHKIKRGKEIINEWCNLNKFIKKDNKLSTNFNKLLYEYFNFDIKFNISSEDGIIKINFLDKEEILDITEYNYQAYKDLPDICKFFMKNISYKEIKKLLPEMIFNNNKKYIKNHYVKVIQNSVEYRKFTELIDSVKKEYDEVVYHLNKYNINFLNKSFDLDSYCNVENYTMEFKNKHIYFKHSEYLFKLDRKIVKLYNANYFKNITKNLKKINIIYYDLQLLFNNKYNTQNLSFNIINNKFYISDFTSSLELNNYDDIYNFGKKTIEKINGSYNLSDEQLKKYIIMYTQNVSKMIKCMDLNGNITLSSYMSFFENSQEAMIEYSSINNIIHILKELDIVSSYSFINKNDYIITFTEEAKNIMKYDCYELRERALNMITSLFTIDEIFKYIPPKYTLDLSTQIDNLKLISLLDDRINCAKYYGFLKNRIKNIDKKYYPLLKMKLNKIDSKETLGQLYFLIKNLCEDK